MSNVLNQIGLELENFEQYEGENYEFENYEYETFGNEFEALFEGNYELMEMEGVLNENEVMELTHELLSISNEMELDRFLGKMFKKVGGAVRTFARSPIGKMVGGALKTVAKKALPIAGKALGTMVGGPIGGMIGGKLAGVAGKAFGLELEGLSAEDREFEVGQAFVRFAADATKRAANLMSTKPGMPAAQVARTALTNSARHYAPGLFRTPGTTPAAASAGRGTCACRKRSGTWRMEGGRIILM